MKVLYYILRKSSAFGQLVLKVGGQRVFFRYNEATRRHEFGPLTLEEFEVFEPKLRQTQTSFIICTSFIPAENHSVPETKPVEIPSTIPSLPQTTMPLEDEEPEEGTEPPTTPTTPDDEPGHDDPVQPKSPIPARRGRKPKVRV